MVRMLTEEKWAQIAPLLPPRKPRGRHRGDDRQTLEGILWVLRAGSRWQNLPQELGSKTQCHRRLKEWQEEVVGEHIWKAFLGLAWQLPQISVEVGTKCPYLSGLPIHRLS